MHRVDEQRAAGSSDTWRMPIKNVWQGRSGQARHHNVGLTEPPDVVRGPAYGWRCNAMVAQHSKQWHLPQDIKIILGSNTSRRHFKNEPLFRLVTLSHVKTDRDAGMSAQRCNARKYSLRTIVPGDPRLQLRADIFDVRHAATPSLSRRLKILPLAVRGSSETKLTTPGTLKRASCWLQNARISSSETAWPALQTMKAHTSSPR